MSKQRQPVTEKPTDYSAERAAEIQKRIDEKKFKRDQFVTALAAFMVDLQAGKGIALSMPPGVIPWAREWATLRQATPLHGYPDRKEAELVLREFLGWL